MSSEQRKAEEIKKKKKKKKKKKNFRLSKDLNNRLLACLLFFVCASKLK